MGVSVSLGLLDHDIREILYAPSTSNVGWTYSVVLHTKADDYAIDLLEMVEYYRNYNDNIADFIVVNFKMAMGDFIKRVVPIRDNLEMSVKIDKGDGDTDIKRYKLVMLNNNKNLYGNPYNKLSQEALNQTEQVILEVQLLDKDVEALRTTFTDGVYNSTTVKDVMIYNIKKAASKVSVGSQSLDVSVRMEEPDNQRIYDHIEVPVGIKMFDLPFYLHDTKYGIYNAGIGMYYQVYGVDDTKSIFIYPLFDKDRFDSVDKKMIIYSDGTDKYQTADNTFTMDGDVLKIIASTVTSIDAGENEMSSTGAGIITSDPNKIMERDTIVKDGKISVDKTTHMEGNVIKNKNDNVDRGIYMGNVTNKYKHREPYIRNMMATYQITWNHSAPEYIYPGMPVMYVMEDDTLGIIKLKGVVQLHYSKYNNATKTTSTILTVMVEKPNIYSDKTATDKIVEDLKNAGV